MDITFIAWVFLFSVLGYYLYDNIFVETPNNSSSNNEEEE